MEVKKLDWDSKFFGLRIGRAVVSAEEDADALAGQKEMLKDNYDLIYVFANHGLAFRSPSAKLIDKKVVYVLRNNSQAEYNKNVIIWNGGRGVTEELLHLASLYNLASVTVVPSLTENLSCTIMESLSCATPVVAFNIGGNGDMIVHQANGYLAKRLDDSDLSEGILWCLENNMDNCLGNAGRVKVLREYTYEVVCRQYVELYKSILF